MVWTYDKRTRHFTCGTEQDGCGIYWDKGNGCWYATMVIHGNMITTYGPYACVSDALQDIEVRFVSFTEKYKHFDKG